jgi:sodium/potassium-transporting ATPase subunit alpha
MDPKKDTKYAEVSMMKGLELSHSPVFDAADHIEDDTLGGITMRRAESSVAITARRVALPKERGMSGVISIQRRISSQLGMDKIEGSRQESFIAPGDRKLSVGIAIQRRASGSVLPTIASEPRKMTRDQLTQKMEEQPEEMKYTEHQFDLPRLSEFFKTHIDFTSPKLSRGLTAQQAQEMLAQFGPNMLTPPARIPLWLLFLFQFLNFFMLLLSAAGVISIIAYLISPSDPTNLYLGILLLVVVFVTCYETFSQEAKSDELMEKFRALVPAAAAIIRDGVTSLIPAEDIVVGDLIVLKSGDKIPADCRIIQAESMKVDQSMVTGEAEPVDISVRAKDPNPLESKNLAFNGSLVVDGSGLGVVIRTGDETLIGSMVELTGDTNKAMSTLKADVEKFVILLTKFALLQAVLIFVVGVARGIPPLDAFIQGFIIILVANVPQGLPSTITAALFIVSERMRKENVLVKKLDIIETLGSCSLICTDKTGTLTMNLMTVANVWVADKTINGPAVYEGGGGEGINVTDLTKKSSSLTRLFEVASLNSRISFQKKSEESAPEAIGDATELGLYRFFTTIIPNVFFTQIEEYRDMNTKLYEIPFNSENKWQMSIHKQVTSSPSSLSSSPSSSSLSSEEKNTLYLKGAPDVLLSKCSHYLTENGEKHLIDDDFMATYVSRYEGFGGNGERVLGFAFKDLPRLLKEEQARDSSYLETLKDNLVGKVSLMMII